MADETEKKVKTDAPEGGAPAPSRRDLLVERLKKKQPDKNFDNDDDLYDQVGADYDDYEGQINGYREREQKMADAYTKNPLGAYAMTSWMDTGEPFSAIIELFGDDLQDILSSEDKPAKIAEVMKQKLEKLAKEKEYEEEYKKNMEETLSMFADRQKAGLNDEDKEKAVQWLVEMAQNVVMGKFTPEMLDMAQKALGYDADMQQASEEGEIRGRNAQIANKLKKADKGDGMPALDSTRGPAASKPRKPSNGALDEMGGKTIYERGGERRIHRG